MVGSRRRRWWRWSTNIFTIQASTMYTTIHIILKAFTVFLETKRFPTFTSEFIDSMVPIVLIGVVVYVWMLRVMQMLWNRVMSWMVYFIAVVAVRMCVVEPMLYRSCRVSRWLTIKMSCP